MSNTTAYVFRLLLTTMWFYYGAYYYTLFQLYCKIYWYTINLSLLSSRHSYQVRTDMPHFWVEICIFHLKFGINPHKPLCSMLHWLIKRCVALLCRSSVAISQATEYIYITSDHPLCCVVSA